MNRFRHTLDITRLDLPTLEKENKRNLIDEGTGRSVFSISEDFVLKVARNKKGLIENENEAYIFQTIPEIYKKILCPVVRYEIKYLIMPMALPVVKIYTDFDKVLDNSMSFIHYLYKEYDLNELDLIFPDNWGIYNGRFVLFDYGSTYIKRLVES